MRAAHLIREARLRAGLTQDELAQRSGVQRSLIGRWEQGAVQPGFDNVLDVIEACGFDLPLMLVARDSDLDGQLDENRLLSPERRAERYLAQLDRELRRG
jgi:transcriptional regulator with XRE-family HTH domain